MSSLSQITASVHGGGGFRPEHSVASKILNRASNGAVFGYGTYVGLEPVRCTEMAVLSVRSVAKIRDYWNSFLHFARLAGSYSPTYGKHGWIWANALSFNRVWNVYPTFSIDQLPKEILPAGKDLSKMALLLRQALAQGNITRGCEHDRLGTAPMNPSEFKSYYATAKRYIHPHEDGQGRSGYGVMGVCDMLVGKAQIGTTDALFPQHYANRMDAKCTIFVDRDDPANVSLACVPHGSEDHLLLTFFFTFDHRFGSQ